MAVEKEKRGKPFLQQQAEAPALETEADSEMSFSGENGLSANATAKLFEPEAASVAIAEKPKAASSFELADEEAAQLSGGEWWRTVRGWPGQRFRVRITLEGALYGLIIGLAIFTRLWDLDFRALHHDEGVHAYYSWRYFSGGGYEQEPWKHGPFLYHITALFFWLFGPSDLVARLPAALFGVLICLLPLALKRELGRWGALTASFLLAISPTFMYFSRFLREDIFMAFATLLFFIGLVRLVKNPSARWWYITMGALGLLFCTKEASYFYMALFFGFVFIWMCWQLAPRLVLIFGAYLAVAVFAFFFVAKLYTPPRIPFEQISGPLLSGYISELISHPIFWTTLILLGLGLIIGWLAFREVAVSRRDFLVATKRAEPGMSAAQALFLPYEAGSPAYLVGWLGRNWKIVGIGLLLLFAIYSVLFTGFFSSPAQGEVGIISGLWYWMAQQGVERGAQPWYYYFFMLPLYEPLALLFGTLGGGLAIFQFVRHGLRRPTRTVLVPVIETNKPVKVKPRLEDEDELDDLEPLDKPEEADEPEAQLHTTHEKWIEKSIPLQQPGNSLWPGKARREAHPYFAPLLMTVWAFGSLGFYTWASEKMPWLTIQLALPFIILTAYFFQPIWAGLEQYLAGRLAQRLTFFNLRERTAFWVLAGGIGFTFCLTFMIGLFLTASALRLNVGGYQYSWIVIWIPPLVALLIFGMGAVVLGSRITLYVTLAVSFVMLSLFLVRTGFGYAFQQGDIPVEMGVYTQTAPDLQRTVKEINNLTTVLPELKTTPILYDDEMRTPLDFWLRDYTNGRKAKDFNQAGLQASGVNNLLDYPVIMMTDAKRDALDETQKKLLDSRYITRHRVFRWWFAEEPYRNFEQADKVETEFLLNKVSKATVKDSEGNVIVRQGETMTEDKLNIARSAKGHVLDQLYTGNGGSALLLNLTEAVNSTVKLGNSADASRLWRYVFYREQVQPLGHLDFTLYIRDDVAGLYRQYGDLVPYPISQP